MIRKISGKSKSPSFSHLNTKRETKATSKEKIANILGEAFLCPQLQRSWGAPTLKKLGGHIASALFVRPPVRHAF